jgi:hypothetical protein
VKKHLVVMLAALALTVGCKEQTPKVAETPAAPAEQSAATPKQLTGNVLETMNAGGYTYVQVDTGSDKIWAAAPEFAVKVGDPVVVPEGMLMTNHESKTLNRKFEKIYFVDAVLVGGAQAAAQAQVQGQVPEGAPQGHPQVDTKAAAEGVSFTGLKKADKTIGEVFSGKDKLAGKDVAIRGKVVKFSPEIMGKNWLHVQDGTGSADANDLTVTTKDVAKVGDTVLITGKLATDKDFGYGYKYALIVEDAKIKVE